jgi:ABC-type dipeptide/oligopeptide/nickel transport system permease subunit
VILFESVLSFLGFGIVPPTPSWGNILTNAHRVPEEFSSMIAISLSSTCRVAAGLGCVPQEFVEM